MNDVLKAVGIVCRYLLAALSCWWFFWFLALIGKQTEPSQELAGTAFAKAIVCGAAAAIWFYRARKAKQVQKLEDYSVKARQFVAPVQPDIVPPAAPTEKTEVIPNPIFSTQSVVEQLPQPEESMPIAGKIFIAVVCSVFIGTIIIVAISNKNTDTPKTEQSQASASAGQKPADLSDIWGPNAKGIGSNSNAVSACPPSLPSGISSKPLARDQVSNLVGSEGSLNSSTEYDDNARPFLMWRALFGYRNNTSSCITSAIVELDLDHNGNVSRERHSVVFDPILGLQESRSVEAKLKIRTSEHSEDVALTGWRIVSVSGFSSGSPQPRL